MTFADGIAWVASTGAITSVVFAIGTLIVRPWFEERMKLAARAGYDKASADYSHELNELLEEKRALEQRATQEFSLYAKQRHRAYARVYRLLRVAGDSLVSVNTGYFPNFEPMSAEDVRQYFAQFDTLPRDTDAAVQAFENTSGSSAPTVRRVAIRQLDHVEKLRRVEHAARRVRLAHNASILEELYYSDKVSAGVREARQRIEKHLRGVRRDVDQPMSVEHDEIEESMRASIEALYACMRGELRSEH